MSVALVVGSAACVWADAAAALQLGEAAGVVACNDAAAAWPGRLDAAVSLHAEKLHLWMARRKNDGWPPPAAIYVKEGERAKVEAVATPYRFTGQAATGSSGLFALKVALVDLGFEKAVLCGVPMDAGGAHYFNAAAWRGAEAHWAGWLEALPQIRDRARSMSGRTADLLGRPDMEWMRA